MINNYETVFILNPVLTEEQVKETVKHFENFIKSASQHKAEIVSKENWGLRKLAYRINRKKSGYYHLFEFKSLGTFVKELNVEFNRNEKIMRHLTIKLDKDALEWSIKRREKQNS